MTLSCFCDYEPCPGDVVYSPPKDYAPLARRRSVRCSSCGVLIRPGELALEFPRSKIPDNEVEFRIYGEECCDNEGPPRAPYHHCERCGDLYLSLDELGFCVDPSLDMREMLAEYHGFASAGRA